MSVQVEVQAQHEVAFASAGAPGGMLSTVKVSKLRFCFSVTNMFPLEVLPVGDALQVELQSALWLSRTGNAP